MKTKTVLLVIGAGLLIGAGFVGDQVEKPAIPVSAMIIAGAVLVGISMK